jgi:hypothetical protein
VNGDQPKSRRGLGKVIFKREPVLIQGAFMALLNLLLAFNVVSITAAQIAALNAVLAAVLGLIVRSVVTPLVDPKNKQGQSLTA